MKKTDRKRIEEYAQSLAWTPKDYYWKHALLVRHYALMIQQKVGGDLDIVEAAALLHDIGKAKKLAPDHEEIGAQMVSKFLNSIGFAPDIIGTITECISYQNFKSLEARILKSADSVSLIMDASGGKEWYFENILENDNNRIRAELQKSYSEIEFDFARKLTEKTFNTLLAKYS
jgi:putative nucleotidyltransferase with HDIG domain